MKGKIMKLSNPSLLVAELRAAGLTLSAHGGKLKAGPADLLTDELRQSIKDRRAEILSILAAEPTPAVNTIPATPMQHSAALAPQSEFSTPEVMAETLLTTMRQIGLRVRLTAQGELRIGPSDMLWPYDRELIEELKPHLVVLLKQEQKL
jgi:hypothetical protein